MTKEQAQASIDQTRKVIDILEQAKQKRGECQNTAQI